MVRVWPFMLISRGYRRLFVGVDKELESCGGTDLHILAYQQASQESSKCLSLSTKSDDQPVLAFL